MTDAIFVREGDLFVPTDLAGSPWGEGVLHGGPPAGLMARAVERYLADDPGLQPVRITVDLFRPVPKEPLRAAVVPVREGKRLAALQVSLFAGDVEVSRAAVLALRTSSIELQEGVKAPPSVPGYEGVATTNLMGALRPPGLPNGASPRGPVRQGFHTTIEVRRVSPHGSDGTIAWLRIPVPLVLGEVTGPFARLAATADFGSPLGSVRSGGQSGFINADISVHLQRLPEGEWLCLEARGSAETTGLGIVHTVVHDLHGPLGRITQAIMANRMG